MLKKTAVYSTKYTVTARAKWRVLSNYKHDVCNCPINAQIGLLIANHVREFCYSFDYTGNTPTVIKHFAPMATHSFRVPTHLISICKWFSVPTHLISICKWFSARKKVKQGHKLKLRYFYSGTRELTLKCKLKCYFKPMNNPLGVSPSKGKQGTTRGKEKIFWPRWESNPRPTD